MDKFQLTPEMLKGYGNERNLPSILADFDFTLDISGEGMVYSLDDGYDKFQAPRQRYLRAKQEKFPELELNTFSYKTGFNLFITSKPLNAHYYFGTSAPISINEIPKVLIEYFQERAR